MIYCKNKNLQDKQKNTLAYMKRNKETLNQFKENNILNGKKKKLK